MESKIPHQGEHDIRKAIHNQSLQHVVRGEFQALEVMQEIIKEQQNPSLGAIRPLSCLPRWNALVMEESEGKNFEELIIDLWARLGLRNRTRFQHALLGAGKWLQCYHANLGKPGYGYFRAKGITEKYQKLIEELGGKNKSKIDLSLLQEMLVASSEVVDNERVLMSLQNGDLYFTNIILTKDDRVALLDFDPRIQIREPIYYDLGTIITELLVQKAKVKSLGFLLSPAYISEGSDLFLEGYFGEEKFDRRFLNFYIGVGMINAMYWYQERLNTIQGITLPIAKVFYLFVRLYLYKQALKSFRSLIP